MAKKLIALLLAVLMLAGMLAGCAKTAETPAPATEDPADTSDSSNTTDTPAPSSDAEPIEISIAYEESTHPVDTDTFAACKKLEETLGSIAGDDTLMCAVRPVEDTAARMQQLRGLQRE